MFGFVRSDRQHGVFRQSYARVCCYHRGFGGWWAAPFVSFEGVLTYLLAIDAGACPEPAPTAPRCCRLQTRRVLRQRDDAPWGEFAARWGLLLLETKLQDDIRDDRSWSARWFRRRLRRPLADTRAYFDGLAPGTMEQLDEMIARHVRLESETDGRRMSLSEYTRPTGEAFRLGIRLLAQLTAPVAVTTADRERNAAAFADVGESLGRAIVAFDCAVDWYSDQKRQRFNPLRHSERRSAVQYATQQLTRAMWKCQDTWGPLSHAARVFANTATRTAAFAHALAPDPNSALPDWGLRRRPGYTYARMDCCDAAGACDCAGGEGCAGEACAGGGAHEAGACGCESGCCFADCCVCLAADTAARRTETKAPPAGATSSEALVGMTGITLGDLKPTGVVEIAGRRLPARTEDGNWLSDGVKVTVAACEGNGVIVRPEE